MTKYAKLEQAYQSLSAAKEAYWEDLEWAASSLFKGFAAYLGVEPSGADGKFLRGIIDSETGEFISASVGVRGDDCLTFAVESCFDLSGSREGLAQVIIAISRAPTEFAVAVASIGSDASFTRNLGRKFTEADRLPFYEELYEFMLKQLDSRRYQ